MTLADYSVTAFTVLNGARIVAYLPQIVCVHRDRTGAWLEFRARRKDVPLQGSQAIRDLLRRARTLFDRADPPEGAAGCEDCRRLEEIWKLLS